MTEEFKAAYIHGLAVCLLARILGMQAENMQRQVEGKSMAYTQDDFERAIDNSGVHHNALMSLFHGAI